MTNTSDRADQLAQAFYERAQTLEREPWLRTIAELLRREFEEIAAIVRRECSVELFLTSTNYGPGVRIRAD